MIDYVKKNSLVKENIMKDLTRGNIYKTFLLFAIPLVLSGVLSQCYNLIDTVIAGKYLGDTGLAAIGCTSAFLSFSSSVFWGYASGAAIHIATLFGAKKFKAIKSAVYHNLGTLIFSSIAFGILVVLCDDPILRFLRVDPSIYADAKLYLDIYILGFFLFLLSNNFVHIMNAFGLSSYPFYMSLLSAVLNISGNILSVTILRMGVLGIVLSSLFAALVVNICYAFKLRQCFKEMDILDIKVTFDFDVIRKFSRYALPCSAQQLIMYIAGLVIAPMVNGISSSASAAYTVIQQIYSFCANIYQNSAKTLSNYTAQCIGANKTHQLKKGVYVGFLQGIAFAAVPVLSCMIFAEPICRTFFPSGYVGDGLTYAIIFLQIYLPFIAFNVVNNLFHSFYRGTASMKLLVSLTATGAVSRIIFSCILIPIYGMQGMYLGWILCWITESILAIVSFYSGSWKKDLQPVKA